MRLESNATRTGQLYASLFDAEFPGRDVSRLVSIIREHTAEVCGRAKRGSKATRVKSPR